KNGSLSNTHSWYEVSKRGSPRSPIAMPPSGASCQDTTSFLSCGSSRRRRVERPSEGQKNAGRATQPSKKSHCWQAPHSTGVGPKQKPPSQASPVVHWLKSSQLVPSGTTCPRQNPSTHVSPVVHWLKSSHGPSIGTTSQVPVALHAPDAHGPKNPQNAPSGATASQLEEQQSKSNWFPSSHTSPGSSTPLPQRLPARLTGYGKVGKPHCAEAVKVRASGATVPDRVTAFPQKDWSEPRSVNAPVLESIVPVSWNGNTEQDGG